MKASTFQSDLVIASCYPLGTDQEVFKNLLFENIKQFGYEPIEIRLSDIVREFDFTNHLGEVAVAPPEARGSQNYAVALELMEKGTALRKEWGRGDSLALLAVSEIAAKREEIDEKTPVCFYIRSLKHTDEVKKLRSIYGPGFYIVGLHSEYTERRSHLIKDRAMEAHEAESLIKKDQGEKEKLGQQTSKVFGVCDYFLWMGDRGEVRPQVSRFVDLLFGHPTITPTKSEYGMFLAFTASLRSADLSRQVGASIFSRHGDIVSLGCNDVPRGGGGLYWPDDEYDAREWKRSYDSNDKEKREIIAELLEVLAPEAKDSEDFLAKGFDLLKDTRLTDITEFGRIVHAEMDALLSAARVGVSVRGGRLYTTTFPCHNCAKHIIAAGISEIEYVEPYPKSLALKLHWDALELDKLLSPPSFIKEGEKLSDDRVKLVPFTGAAARRFTDFFSMGWSSGRQLERKAEGKAVEWSRSGLEPRVPMLPFSYLEKQDDALDELKELKNDES